jgi:cellulose synthase/poly-beta-1,6-N-acetylglucosamine synthase-like glycosyltransferase
MTAAEWIFIVSALLIGYILFGYPILLQLWPGKRKQSYPKEPKSYRTVSVILPVKNGARWIDAKLRTLAALDYPQQLIQTIVISDNCSDRTDELVRAYSDRVLLLQNPHAGKSSAINHALQHATGEILFMTDVRQEIEPGALKALVACFDDPEVGVASGELIIRKSDSTEEENVSLYWKYEKWIRLRHSSIHSVMGATGAIYAMRRALARPLPDTALLDDVQLPLGAFFAGYRILLVEHARAYDIPTALDQEFHRKVRTLAGVYQTIGAFPQLIGPKNRMWFHFLSHKFARLLLPYLLIAVLLSSFFLPSPWNGILVSAQLAFYGLALLDPLIAKSPLKKVSSLARTFTVLMFATLLATSILFRPSESFWKTAR